MFYLIQYLERIGEYFFNIKKTKAESGGMFCECLNFIQKHELSWKIANNLFFEANIMRMLTNPPLNDSTQNNISKNVKSESDYDQDEDEWDSFRDVEDNDLLD